MHTYGPGQCCCGRWVPPQRSDGQSGQYVLAETVDELKERLQAIAKDDTIEGHEIAAQLLREFFNIEVEA